MKNYSYILIFISYLFLNTYTYSAEKLLNTVQPSQKLQDSFSAFSNRPMILSEEPPPHAIEPQPDPMPVPTPVPPPLPDLTTKDQYTLILQKSALEKEFLLSASIIPQNGSPTSQGLNGKIVAFKKGPHSVFLLEATNGHIISTDLPSQLILAEIPILNETPDSLTLDFNTGMKKVFTIGNWFTSDFESKNYSVESQTSAAEIMHSFIQSILFKSNYLEIRQIAQMKETTEDGTTSFPSYEVRYFISPYIPNSNYKSKELSDLKKVGYFELPPFYEKNSGRSIIHITRFDETKTIPFFYSANTPAEYQEAVKEGILYWNKAFGKEMITAQKAPDGVTAPDPNYNMVQWVPYDLAGFAYADALMDPRTGQTLHGQAYLTSAFSFGSKMRTRTLLRNLNELSSEAKMKILKTLQISFMGSSKMCQFHAEKNFQTLLENALSAEADDATLLRLSQDYVRMVTAHEVGHILGLRHNFAGNLGSNLLPQDRQTVFETYIKDSTIPLVSEKTPTSSVMEYLGFADDVIAGAQIKKDTVAYNYDINAIQWGYYQKPLPAQHPLFCTDSGKPMEGFADCITFDSGPEQVAHYLNIYQTTLKNLPMLLVEKFISAKAPLNPDFAKPIEEVALEPKVEASALIANSLLQIRQWFNASTKSLKVAREFNFSTSINEKAHLQKKWEQLQKQLTTVGGYKNVLFALSQDKEAEELFATLQKTLQEFLAKESVKSFIGHDGKAHTWTEAELAYIQSIAPQYFQSYIRSIQEMSLISLSGALFDLEYKALEKLDDSTMSAEIENSLFQVSSQYLLKQDDSKLLTGTVKNGTFEPTILVKDYYYPNSIRLAAISILDAKMGPINDWSLTSRTKLSNAFEGQLNSQFVKDIGEISPLDISRPLRQWFFEQMELLKEL